MIKKNDTVQIMVGKDLGKQGKVLSVDSPNNRVVVQGVNVFKKHQRPKKQGEKGEVVSVSRSINASNVMLVCNSCGKPVRAGYRYDGDAKIRYCKKCQSAI